MAEKADIMKLAIDNGIYDLDTIRKSYNEFAKGGIKNQNTWTMEDDAKYREWRDSLPDIFEERRRPCDGCRHRPY